MRPGQASHQQHDAASVLNQPQHATGQFSEYQALHTDKRYGQDCVEKDVLIVDVLNPISQEV